MTKYLGSFMSIFGAIAIPLYICVFVLFGVSALYSEISFATIFIIDVTKEGIQEP